MKISDGRLDIFQIKTKQKGHVKLIQQMEIAHSFLHVISKLFQFTILNLSG